MSRNFITKNHKKKVSKPIETSNPQELAQLHLMEISDQANLKQQNGQTQIQQSFLKHLHLETKQLSKKVFNHVNLHNQAKFKQNNCQSYRSPYKDITKTNSINNRISGSQVFVGTKNSLALTNYLMLDDEEKIQKNVNISYSLPLKNSTYVKKMKRRKSLSTNFQISHKLFHNVMAINSNRAKLEQKLYGEFRR